MQEMVSNMIAEILTFPLTLLQTVTDAIGSGVSGDTNSVVGNISNIISDYSGKILEVFVPVAFAIVILYWLIGLTDLLTSDRFNLETFFKHTASLAVGVILVGNSSTIFNAMKNFGDGLSKLITAGNNEATTDMYSSLTTDIAKALNENISGMEWLLLLGAGLILGAIFILIALGLYLAAHFALISRIIELNVRGIFLPIGLAALAEEGFRGRGGSYFKRLLAVCATGAGFVVIGVIMGEAQSAAVQQLVTNIGNVDPEGFTSFMSLLGDIILELAMMMVIGISGVMSLFKVQNIMNEAFAA